jgi:hypothetical protein
MVNIVNHIILIYYKSIYKLVYFRFTMFTKNALNKTVKSKLSKPYLNHLGTLTDRTLTANY